MKNIRILILVIGIFVVAITTFAIGQFLLRNDVQQTDVTTSRSNTSAKQTNVSRLTTENRKEREKAAEAIRNDHTELIKRLIQLAAAKVEPLPSSDPRFVEYPWHDSKHLAILLLGDLRAAETVPALLDNLKYKNPRSLVGGLLLDKGGWYPAAEALSKIGMPAVGPMIDKLGDSAPNSKDSELCCWVLKKILGVKLARLRLQIDIEETRDEAVKNNLTAVLPYFKTEQEKAAEERARRVKNSG